MEKIKYIIFDLDGTLYEKKSVVKYYLKEFADHEGYDFSQIHKSFTLAYTKASRDKYASPTQFWSKVHDIFLKDIKSNKKQLLDNLAEEAKNKVLTSIKPRPFLIELFKKIKDIGFKEVHYNGGEPLLRKEIYDILGYSSDIGLHTVLETNATYLTFPNKINLKGLTIRASIDGSEKVHNYIRCTTNLVNSYRLSLENLAKAKEIGIPVQITCSINSLNHDSIYQMISEINEYHLDDIRLRLTMPTGFAITNWGELEMSKDELLEVIKQIECIKEKFPSVHLNDASLKRDVPKFEPKFFIDPRGFVKPYPFIEYFAGDLNKESVSSILEKIPSFKLPVPEEIMIINYLKNLGMVK